MKKHFFWFYLILLPVFNSRNIFNQCYYDINIIIKYLTRMKKKKERKKERERARERRRKITTKIHQRRTTTTNQHSSSSSTIKKRLQVSTTLLLFLIQSQTNCLSCFIETHFPLDVVMTFARYSASLLFNKKLVDEEGLGLQPFVCPFTEGAIFLSCAYSGRKISELACR